LPAFPEDDGVDAPSEIARRGDDNSGDAYEIKIHIMGSG
jgi:hypothetical protein